MTKTILENEHGKYGWCIKVFTENIYQIYLKDYFKGNDSDRVHESRFNTDLKNCTVYKKVEAI